MNDREWLEEAFQNYLQSGLDSGAAVEMCRALDGSGLHHESKALRDYWESATLTPQPHKELTWDRYRCFSGLYPPVNPKPHDVWFDVVELTPMMFIPEDNPSQDQSVWLAMHPVYLWQFKGFLRCVKLGRKLIEFESPSDYLSAARFDGVDPRKIVTDIYHDEALAYAFWFGKTLCGQFELRDARTFLNESEFSMVLPAGIRLWDDAEFPASEFVRTAIGNDTLYKEESYEEFLLREAGENIDLPDRMLYEEWERRPDISFSTCVPLFFGITRDLPIKTIYFEFQNAAPR